MKTLLEEGTGKDLDFKHIEDEDAVKDVKDGIPFLLREASEAVAKYIKERYARMDKQMRTVQNELRVNWLRFSGDVFAQVHPLDNNRVFTPANSKSRNPPSINKIRRMVHRYVAQVTADEPVMEGSPATHNDDARDAAEAATQALSGEWQRMNLQRKLQRVQEVSAILRSGFWSFEWDSTAGGKVKAQKFFRNAIGKQELSFVDSAGNKVDDAEQAADVWEGNMTCEVLTPLNVRWSGGSTIKEAEEVFTAKLITLSQLYDSFPAAKKVKIKHLIGEVSPEMEDWLHELRGAGGIASRNKGQSDDDMDRTGEQVTEQCSLLDEYVLFLNMYKKPSRDYPGGFHGMIAGKHLLYRGKLRYGKIPVAQFKCLDDLVDPLGLALVDLLKDPQELMDFVNGQILRFLQSMKRRWFVPLTSGVNTRDLLNPTRSIIHYNSNSQAPTPEAVPEIPKTMTDWADRFDKEFNDQAGIHDIMQGKHVPGVSSGRHAEALRSGDETILGLTRTMIQEALEDAGEIMLAIIQKEWKTERKVRYFSNRQYVERAFSNTDFGSTSKVHLKRGTLLMLTQAQKLETLYSYVEMGALTVDELRKLAPLVDTAGISITEDPHYQRARRENDAFLAGPPKKLVAARKAFDDSMETLASELAFANDAALIGGGSAKQAAGVISERVMLYQEKAQRDWDKALKDHLPVAKPWEATMKIAQIHVEEHSAALAGTKAENFPKWWVEIFEGHVAEHMQALVPPPEPGAEGAPPPAPEQPMM